MTSRSASYRQGGRHRTRTHEHPAMGYLHADEASPSQDALAVRLDLPIYLCGGCGYVEIGDGETQEQPAYFRR